MAGTLAVDNPKVESLKHQAKKSLRQVMRRLVEIRRLNGTKEIANLGELLREVGTEQEPSLAPDPRLLEARNRGMLVRQKLIEAEGGSLSADDAAAAMGMSKVAVLKRYQNRRLVAWRGEKQNAVRFPAWQFKEGKVVPGLEEVLATLNAGSRLDDFGRMLFFLSKSRFLGGKRPLDCLREGEVHKVIQAAQGYAQ